MPFADRSYSESGRNAIVEVHLASKDYGCRPSDLLMGDSFALLLDLIVNRTGRKWEYEEHEKARQKY